MQISKGPGQQGDPTIQCGSGGWILEGADHDGDYFADPFTCHLTGKETNI